MLVLFCLAKRRELDRLTVSGHGKGRSFRDEIPGCHAFCTPGKGNHLTRFC